MFTSGQIKTLAKKKPFVPLRIVTSGGESYTVTHAELLWIGTRDIHVGKASMRDPTIYADVTRIPLPHITAIEELT